MSLGDFAKYFWTYSVWSVEFLFLFPQILLIFLAATASLSISFWRQRPFQHPLWKRSHWLVLTQLLFFPIVICLGILYPANGPSSLRAAPNSTASVACECLGWLSLALAVFWVYRMKGFRWFAVSAVAVLETILLGAFFVAGMAISGDWL